MKLTKLLLAAPLMFFAVNGQVMAQDEHQFDVPAKNLFTPRSLAETSSLRYDNGNFHVTLDGTERQVARYNVRGVLAGVPEEKLEEVLKVGFFQVGGNEAEPTLEWKGRVLGGVKNPGATTAAVVGGSLGTLGSCMAVGACFGPIGLGVGALVGTLSAPLAGAGLGAAVAKK